jgi:hypothetical protein
MGYGKRALEALDAFYSGVYVNLDEQAEQQTLDSRSLWRVDEASATRYQLVICLKL